MKKTVWFVAPLFVLSLSGCETYSLVQPGSNQVGAVTVTPQKSWNSASAMLTPSARRDSKTWTQDGLLLDRLMIIPDVPDGEAIFKSRDKSAALPVFRADMLPNEIEELVESSMAKMYGEGNAVLSTENLRPQKFGQHQGFMFEIDAAVSDSPDYRGIVGAIVIADRLNLVAFIAALPHYFDKHREAVERLIKTTVVRE